MFEKYEDNEDGLTLVEILIAMSVFVTVAVITMSVIITASQNNAKQSLFNISQNRVAINTVLVSRLINESYELSEATSSAITLLKRKADGSDDAIRIYLDTADNKLKIKYNNDPAKVYLSNISEPNIFKFYNSSKVELITVDATNMPSVDRVDFSFQESVPNRKLPVSSTTSAYLRLNQDLTVTN